MRAKAILSTIISLVYLFPAARAQPKPEGVLPIEPSPRDSMAVFHQDYQHWQKWPASDNSIINWELLEDCMMKCVKDLNNIDLNGFDAFVIQRRAFCEPFVEGTGRHNMYRDQVMLCASQECKHKPSRYFNAIMGDTKEFFLAVCDNPVDMKQRIFVADGYGVLV